MLLFQCFVPWIPGLHIMQIYYLLIKDFSIVFLTIYYLAAFILIIISSIQFELFVHILSYMYPIHQQQHYNPKWTFAFPTTTSHSTLFLAFILQFLTPRLAIFFSTSSIHLFFGRHFRLSPSILVFSIILGNLLSWTLSICPNHLNLRDSIKLTIFSCPNNSSISSFDLILHSPFIYMRPYKLSSVQHSFQNHLLLLVPMFRLI